ncbi:unnamed protein product, partial [Coregonus sp. 'balchen']
PSLAPHNAPSNNANTGGVSDGAVVSGIGAGERLFPPPSGLSYSTWFCVERFSSAPHTHPVRLLTVLPCCARFRCGELIGEGQWHHLLLVMSKGMLKNSMATLYIDGQLFQTTKLHYIHSSPGGSGSTNPPVVSTVYSYIGTPPAQRQLSNLVWRLGPTHFLEEGLPAASVAAVYELGPNYTGSFQAVYLLCKDSKTGEPPCPVALVPEEKVSFSLYALSVSALTVAKIRKVYNKLDSKAIAKQLAVSSHENATPVKLIHNAAGHLNGPARTIGAAVIGYLGKGLGYLGKGLGYLGVRAFVPKPVATNLQYVGGAAAILGLVAMAQDVEGLYAAVKAMVCVVKSNPLASKEMERIKGYQLLAMLLKKKRHLLNSHILHLTFSLVGTVDSGHETSIIPNSTAFQDLLCDFEVWLHAPYELHLSLFEHFIELLTESSEAAKNAKLLREFQLIPKLLLTLRDTSLSQPTVSAISNVLSLLLQGFPNPYDLLRFGQFISSTLPTFAVCEKFVVMEINNEEKLDGGNDEDFGGLLSANLILACEELVRTLGFDWLLMFMEEHLHPSSVTAALWVLVVLLSNQPVLTRFKEGLTGGDWLDHTDSVLTNKIGTVLGFNVGRSAGGRSTLREINRDACHFPGFPVLQTLLPKHTNVPELYFLLMALFLQQPVTELPDSLQFDLDSIWTFIFGVPASSGTVVGSIHSVCTEAGFLLLGMLRSMLNLSEEEGSWLREYPVTLMQFFRYLYHNVPDLTPMWHSPEFLCVLAASVFVFNIRPYSEMVSDLDDEAGSPTEEFKAFTADTGMNRSQSEYCNVGSKTYLTNHPAKKYVFDFMKVLIMDNLCEDASLPITSGGSYQVLVNNVFYFTQRVVDKLWQGMFNKESKMVVEFIVQLIGQSKRRSQSLSLDPLYHCLNRTVLYQLSRPHKTVPQQVALLDSLRVLTVNRNLVLGPGNHDQDFVACLAHCFINLHVGSGVVDRADDSKRAIVGDIFKMSIPHHDRGGGTCGYQNRSASPWKNRARKKCISRGESVAPASQSKLSRRQQNVLKYVTEEWSSIEYELLRERGLWGPPIGSHLDKFLLEMTEGPCRMRKKMVRNDMFYIHYPYVPEPEPSTNGQKPVRYRRAISYDSKEYYMRLLSGNPGMYQHSVEQDTEGETTQHEPGEAPLKRSRSTTDRADEEQDLLQEQLLESGGLDEEQRTDNTSLLRLLEEGEKIQHMYRCARVQGLDTSEGLLLFGKEHFYVIDGFTMTVSREIRDIETLPSNLHETIIPRGARQGQSQLKRTCSIFAYEDIKEVFSGDGRNYLLAFQKGVRNKVYQRFLAVVPSLADSSESVSGQRPNTSVEQGSGLLSTLVGEKSVTQRWERGEISNFQYLMHLNTLAGRSYNDLMQYPVFPWILADYDSEELDLNNPRTFRNLAKPMGAQTDDRLTQYKKRFKDWEDPTTMIIASYLIRMEPFTQIFLRLQAWLSASKHNMADVKELIPEFFYLPEFMLNSNNFDLGAKQNGIRLGDVLLPPWAKGDPREFIRALECDYVSAHLHEWIDLIFGFKQQGPPAVEAVNVFHHLFYEGQLFKKPHPPKRLKEPVGQIVCTDKGVLAVEQNKVLQPPAWNKTFAWGYADLSCRLANYESDKAVVVYECLSEWGQILCAICPNPKLVITGGTSTAICVWETGTSKERAKTLTLKQALLGHTDTVTCLTASSAYHIMVSGSRDRTCIIWDLNKLSFVTQLRGHRAPVSALCINELTGDIVSAAGTYIHVWSINGSPIASANTFTGRSQLILCCCVSEMNEWDTQNVIVTGHSDGVVRFWRMEFLQVPETPAPEPIEHPDVTDCCTEDKLVPRGPGAPGGRPGVTWSVDSGSDDSRRWSDTLSLDEKDGFVFVNYSEGQTGQGQTPLKPGVHPHPQPHPPHPIAGHGGVPQPIHPTTMEARPYNQLRADYRWERQLVFRSKLTMHTAFNRNDNAHPAEITSLAISKDHSKILVGDGRGRVFSWSVSDQPGRSAADHWVKDEVVDCCSGCTSEIKRLKISSPVRVCQNCYYNLQHERSAEDGCRN